MTRTVLLLIMWAISGIFCRAADGLQDPEASDLLSKGPIEGVVRDIDGNPVAGASVLLCHGQSGYPMVAGAKTTIVETFVARSPSEGQTLDFAITDKDGNFRFENIPLGTWRLLARQATHLDPDENNKFPGLTDCAEEILLLGTAIAELDNAFGVAVELRQPGEGVLKLDEKVPNDDTILLVSSGKPRGDPVLGPIAIGGAFLQQLAGWNHMPGGRTVIRGLPDGEVYFFLISPDNSPGFGSGHKLIAGPGVHRGRAPFVAGWSDAIHDPPAELADLFGRIRELETTTEFRLVPFLASLGYQMSRPADDPAGSKTLYADLEKEIELPDGSKGRLIDLLAVMGYQRLQDK